MSKAHVGKANHAVFSDEASGIPDRYEEGWGATHECGWWEFLTEWHNAFWAADHHVRYDCGKREHPSSGGYQLTVYGPSYSDHESYCSALLDPHAGCDCAVTWMRNGMITMTPKEGGAQNDPTPSDMGDPLPPACAEDATVELGAITTELGPVQWEGRHLEGWSEGASGGSAGWWARVRRGRAR